MSSTEEPEQFARLVDVESAWTTIRETGKAWEQDPSPYYGMGEEDLRGVLLSALNGAFAGAATAESLSNRGKSDILIRRRSTTVFVGECKVYNGAAGIAEALDQLQSYGTWRDKNLGLIVFVRSTSMSTAIAALAEGVGRCARVTNVENIDDHGAEVLVTATRPGDKGHEVQIRVLLVNVPQPSGRRPRRAADVVHPDDAIEALLEIQRVLPDDDGVAYTPTLEPDAPLEAGSGWRVTHSKLAPDGAAAGIVATPVTKRGLLEHAPEGALVAPDDETARQLAASLRRTERDFVPTEMRGVGVRFDRIPAALRDAADRTQAAHPDHTSVIYRAHGLWQTEVTLDTDRGKASTRMAFRVVDSEEGWDAGLRGSLFDFALTINFRDKSREVTTRWELTRDESTSQERLTALEFLDIYSGSGTMVLTSIEPDLGVQEFGVAAFTLDEDTRFELELLRNVVAVQQHCEAEIALPQVVPNPWIQEVFNAGTALRTGSVNLKLPPAEVRIAAGDEIPTLGEDVAVPFQYHVKMNVGELEVDLGVGHGLLQGQITALNQQTDGSTTATVTPPDDETASVALSGLTTSRLADEQTAGAP